MCGIAGIVALTKNGSPLLSKTENALNTLSKRGPDNRGVFNHNRVSLGHTRLSVIDISEAASQPFTDHTGRYTIIYNGEFYNYKEHKKELEQKGVQFRSDSDTEVLLYLYIFYGVECLQKVNGFFAFAIYDKEKESLFLARDRIGIKPLLFYRDEEIFVFASEMKSLMAYGIPKEIDDISLFTYLQLNYIPGPQTIFNGVSKLLPGNYLTVGCDPVSVPVQYYKIPYNAVQVSQVELSSYQSAQKELFNTLDTAVKNRLVADVPIGTFLSGGIDSSIITMLAARHVKGLNSFSIGFRDHPFFDETKYARMLAKQAKTNHTVFSLTNDDLLENLYNILDYIDEPFADSSAIPVNILSQRTKKHITVALSGDGADELFSGYNKHYAEYKARNPGIAGRLLKGIAPLISTLPQSRNKKLSNWSRQLIKYSKGVKLNPKLRYWRWASILDEEEANFLIKEEETQKIHRISDKAFQYKKRKDLYLQNIRKNGDLNDVLYTDMHLVLPNDMLVKVDSMSMAHGLEVRVPFLDHNVVELAFTLPAEFKINAIKRKKILLDTFGSLLPQEILNRPKKGFEVPLLAWFKHELRSLMEDLLNDQFIMEQGIFNNDAVTRLKGKLFSKNPGDSAATVWALIVFQHWWKKWAI